MSDILKQVQELQEQFNNLFEVDGLGNPAVDVPPSQNKIKRDRKTKDGKVEVVSVEDELFPYEGNKREQFRQKVIATINDMIQGTATLEDLLQLVRQKKAPLKEAAELLEQSIYEWFGKKKEEKPDPTKSIVGRTLRGKEGIYNQYVDDIEKYTKRAAGATGYRAEVNAQRAADAERKAAEAHKDLRHTKGEYLDLLKKRGLTNPQAHAVLKKAIGEAIELMEDLTAQILKQPAINEVSDKTANSFLEKRVKNAVDAWYNDDKLNKKEDNAVKALIKRKVRQGKELSDDEKKRIEETFSIVEAIINELHPDTVNNALNKRIDQSIEADEKDSKEFKKILDMGDKEARAKAYANFKKRTSNRAEKEDKKFDNYVKYAKRHSGELKIEEAIELMEDLTAQILKQPVEKRVSLFYKLKQGLDKDTRDSYTKAQEEEKQKSKEEKGQEKTEQRKKYRGKSIEDWKQGRLMDQIARNAKNLGKLNDPATAKAIRRHNSKIGEALELMEEALNILIEGRKERESQEDFKHRLHGELVRAIDNKAAKAKEEAIEGKKGAYEKYKKEHAKLAKLDDIEPVVNAYCEALDKAEEVAKELNELFDRPDLLVDIDTMLGSPVKKAKDKILKQILEPKKEKKEEKKTEKKVTCSKK